MDAETAARIAREVRGRERAKLVREYRTKWLERLGWQVRGEYNVGPPPDRAEEIVSASIAAAARIAGLPDDLEGLILWGERQRRGQAPERARDLSSDTRSRERPASELDNAGDVGEDWVSAEPTLRGRGLLTAQYDREIVERGLQGHIDTEATLAECVRSMGHRPLRPNLRSGDPPFDLAWTSGGTIFVAEVKSTTEANEEQQLRLGLGQVLRYRWQLTKRGAAHVKALLVPETVPSDPDWEMLCASLGVALLPGPRIGDLLPDLTTASDS